MAYYFDLSSYPSNAHVPATGAGATQQPRQIVMSFEQYEIVLAVTEDNRVLGVVEVRQKKDFRTIKQKIAATGAMGMERFLTE